jgi:hypothetical protein
MKTRIIAAIIFTFFISKTRAQTAAQVTDRQPVNFNGLTMGYKIKSEEVKAVGDKGDFSRFSINFYVTNSTNEEKIILYKQGWNVLNNVSDQLVQFNVLNATGARFTSKAAIINAAPCSVLAEIEEKDCTTNKTTKNKRFVQIGYSIKAGQTFSTNAIVIVPLNQKPDVEVAYLATQLGQPLGAASSGLPVAGPGAPPNMQPPPPVQYNTADFLKFRNTANNTYINVETGVPSSSNIDAGWWSAQWQLIPMPGSNNYYIKNRWKESYLGTDGKYVTLTADYDVPSCMWIMISPQQDIVRFKNAKTGGFLSLGYDRLIISSPASTDMRTASWQLEKAN